MFKQNKKLCIKVIIANLLLDMAASVPTAYGFWQLGGLGMFFPVIFSGVFNFVLAKSKYKEILQYISLQKMISKTKIFIAVNVILTYFFAFIATWIACSITGIWP